MAAGEHLGLGGPVTTEIFEKSTGFGLVLPQHAFATSSCANGQEMP